MKPNFIRRFLKLNLVIGRSNCPEGVSINSLVQAAVRGGVTSVQLREDESNEDKLVSLAQTLKNELPADIPLVINDYVSIAKELQLPVHLGQTDTCYLEARRTLGEDAVIGLSIENEEQAVYYKGCGADYFGVGPIFPTKSRFNAAPAVGLERLGQIVDILEAPCVAIGGIEHRNAQSVYELADGVAVISAVTQHSNPEQAARELLSLSDTSLCNKAI